MNSNKIRIGRGTNAKVYEIERNGRKEAVKIFHKEVSLKAIQSELDLLKQISAFNHPHIIRYYDYDTLDNKIHLFMELADGGALQKCLADSTTLIEARTVLSWLQQILGAVEFLHRNKIMHRDINPNNLLLHNNGKMLKIADFGLARCASYGTTRELGTAGYVAPETITGLIERSSDKYNHACDVFSIGRVVEKLALKLKNNPMQDKINTISKKCITTNPDERPSIKTIQVLAYLIDIWLRSVEPQHQQGDNSNERDADHISAASSSTEKDVENLWTECKIFAQANSHENCSLALLSSLDQTHMHESSVWMQYWSDSGQTILIKKFLTAWPSGWYNMLTNVPLKNQQLIAGAILSFLREHLATMVNDKTPFKLSKDQLVSLLASEISNENLIKLANFTIDWVLTDVSNRHNCLKELLMAFPMNDVTFLRQFNLKAKDHPVLAAYYSELEDALCEKLNASNCSLWLTQESQEMLKHCDFQRVNNKIEDIIIDGLNAQNFSTWSTDDSQKILQRCCFARLSQKVDSIVEQVNKKHKAVSHASPALNRIFVFGGDGEDNMASSICSVGAQVDHEWQDEPFQLPRPRYGGAAAVLKRRVLLIGGLRKLDNKKVSQTTADIVDWAQYPSAPAITAVNNAPLLSRRGCDAVAVHWSTKVLIAGGDDGTQMSFSKPLKSVELYDELLGCCVALPDMNEERSRFALAVNTSAQPNRVFATGGGSSTWSVEFFDLAEQRWSLAPSMNGGRENHAAASLDNCVYVAGGGWPGNSVNYLDAREPRWQATTDMIHRRQSHRLLAVDDQHLIAIGGKWDKLLTSVERFDSRNRQWQEAKPNMRERDKFQAVVM